MAQSTYIRGYSAAFPGQLAEDTEPYLRSLTNAESSAAITPGVFVRHSAENAVTNLSAGTDEIAGVVVNSFAREPGVDSAIDGWAAGTTVPVLDEGAVWVLSEEALAVGDPVHTRFVAHTGVGTVLGAIRNDVDTNGTATCRRVKGARVLAPTYTDVVTGKLITKIYFDASVEYAASVAS